MDVKDRLVLGGLRLGREAGREHSLRIGREAGREHSLRIGREAGREHRWGLAERQAENTAGGV